MHLVNLLIVKWNYRLLAYPASIMEAQMYNKETQKWEGYIYKIYSDIDNKVYIGQTQRSVKDRWQAHLSCVRNKSLRQLNITTAIRYYGEEHFSCVKVYTVVSSSHSDLQKELDRKERYYISFYNSIEPHGYNIKSGGTVGSGKPIVLYSYDGKYIREFGCIVDAANILGMSANSIRDCCKGRTHRTKYGIFRFKDDPFILYDTSKAYKPLNVDNQIIQYDINGNVFKEFSSIRECAKCLSRDRATICNYLSLHYYHDGYVLFFRNELFDKTLISFNLPKRNTKIKRINIHTNEEIIYKNKSVAAQQNNMNLQSLNYRLYGRTNNVFDDYIYQFC